MRIEDDIDPAGIFIFREDFRPSFTAVARPENSAFGVWAESVTKCRHDYDVGIIGMDDEGADLTGVTQPGIFPVFSCIDRFVNAGAVSGITANGGFTSADVNGVVIGRRDRERANGRNVLLIKERRPIRSAIHRFPDPARNCAEVPGIRFPRNTFDRQCPSATKWSDLPPLHSGKQFRIDLRRRSSRRRWRTAKRAG